MTQAELARHFGVSRWTLTRLYNAGRFVNWEVPDIARALRLYGPKAGTQGDVVSEAEAREMSRMHDDYFDALHEDGSLLPLAGGGYYPRDLVEFRPHRFAILPPHPDYTPCRPLPNPPEETSTASLMLRRNVLRRKRNTCPLWRLEKYGSGWMYVLPDGYFQEECRRIENRWTQVFDVAAPIFWPGVQPDAKGRCPRIFINGYTTRSRTVVNLGILDDYGVMARGYGNTNKSYAWHDALLLAMDAIGWRPLRAVSLEAELVRLVRWVSGEFDEVLTTNTEPS